MKVESLDELGCNDRQVAAYEYVVNERRERLKLFDHCGRGITESFESQLRVDLLDIIRHLQQVIAHGDATRKEMQRKLLEGQ